MDNQRMICESSVGICVCSLGWTVFAHKSGMKFKS